MSYYTTAAEAIESWVVPENPMPGRSEYHDKLEAEYRDVVAIQIRMSDTKEMLYMAQARKNLDLYYVGSPWHEHKKNGRSFVVTAVDV